MVYYHASSLHKINASAAKGSAIVSTLHINVLLFSPDIPIHCCNQPVSVAELNANRQASAAALSNNINNTNWETENIVNVNAWKT